MANQTQTPQQAFSDAQSALAAAQANMDSARSAVDAAKAQLEAARLALPVVERYSPLAGSPVRLTLASSGSVIEAFLVACYAEGALYRQNAADPSTPPTFLPWSAIEDILPN